MSAGVVLGAVGACLLGGVLPWINSEVVVAGAAAFLPSTWLPPLVVACAAAQLAAKTGLFAVARWAPHRLPRKARAALERGRAQVEKRPRRVAQLLILSAALGLPPFYLTALVAGAAGTPVGVFVVAGGVGVTARTAAIAWIAHATLAPESLSAQAVALRAPPLAAATRLSGGCRGEGDPLAREVAEALAHLQAGAPAAALDRTLDSLATSPLRQTAGPEASYHTALLLGARLETLEGRARIEGAQEVHRLATRVLQATPTHGGAHHLLGRLNAAVLRLSGTKRLVARLLVGGDLLARASWADARHHLEAAERHAPCLPEHHLELARLLRETGDLAGAQREVGHVMELLGSVATGAPMSPRAEELRNRALSLVARQ